MNKEQIGNASEDHKNENEGIQNGNTKKQWKEPTFETLEMKMTEADFSGNGADMSFYS